MFMLRACLCVCTSFGEWFGIFFVSHILNATAIFRRHNEIKHLAIEIVYFVYIVPVVSTDGPEDGAYKPNMLVS